MPGSGEFGGLGSRQTPVKLIANADFSKVKLSPQEGFVLSRVDGAGTLDTLCMLSGLGKDPTVQIIRRLADLGLISVEGYRPSPPAPAAAEERAARRSPSEERSAARKSSPTGEPSAGRSSEERPPARSADAEGTDNGASAPALPDEPDVDLKPEIRASIRAVYGRLQELNLFQLLDADPSSDATTLRRAYFKRSKEFHPDRYFAKRLGPYKVMLDEVFKQVSAAYKFLEVEDQRKMYREMLLSQQQAESQVREVEEQGARAMEESDELQVPEKTRGPSSEYILRREDLESSAERAGPTREAGRRQAAEPAVTDTEQRAAEEAGGEGRPAAAEEAEDAEQAEAAAAAAQQKVAELVEDDAPEDPAEADRRQKDRQRRLHRITSPFTVRSKKARGFYEQGMKQLAEGQVLAAAASLKLALSFGGEDSECRKAYEQAAEHSRAVTAEGYFKRAAFEDSVGRSETARKFYILAADSQPKALYLQKAAECLLAARDLIKAKDYATKAVQDSPDSVEARTTLARVYDAAGMAKNARRELQEALKIDPGNSVAKELLRSLRGT